MGKAVVIVEGRKRAVIGLEAAGCRFRLRFDGVGG